MRALIKPYTIIYYLSGSRYELSFSASSKPSFEIENVLFKPNDVSFEDTLLTEEIKRKIIGIQEKDIFKLILKLNKILGEDCMAFNHNA